MTPEFVQLLRDWSGGLFWIAFVLVCSTSISIGNAKRKIVVHVDCPHHGSYVAEITDEQEEQD